MNKSALQDIQQALNAIRSEIERVDDETKWAALELMLEHKQQCSSISKEDGKARNKDSHTHCSCSKDKDSQATTTAQTTPKDTERTDFTPIRPQPPLPNQQTAELLYVKTVKTARFVAVWQYG